MLSRERIKLYSLVDKWRAEARELMRMRRDGDYCDQTSSVRLYVEAQTLRHAATALKRRLDDLQRKHY